MGLEALWSPYHSWLWILKKKKVLPETVALEVSLSSPLLLAISCH